MPSKDPELLRAEGNAAFSVGNYLSALALYTQGLQASHSVNNRDNAETETETETETNARAAAKMAELWSNRAACFMKLDRPELAAADAYALLDLR